MEDMENVILELVELGAGLNKKGTPDVFAVKTISTVPDIVAVAPTTAPPAAVITPCKFCAMVVAVADAAEVYT